MGRDLLEITKGAAVGIFGMVAVIDSVNIFVSIAVGLATVSYLVAKTYFLIKNKGK